MRGGKAAALALVTAAMLAVTALSAPAGAATTAGGTARSGYDDPITKILDTITASLARNPVAQVVDQIISGTVGRVL